MNNSIGFKIKRLREQKHISQEDLAHQLDVSQSYLSKIETGAIEKIDFLFMQKITDFFQVDLQYFFDDHIVQSNTDNNHHSAAGNIYSTITIHNSVPEDVLENLIRTQNQISKLMEIQSQLIEKLINSKLP
ncbi:helix-turn-helix domain-containing protein [Fluviicola sp.]|jgi:transcriptional regulator with XRE-family HTH domain|uniref:helix-turn-helix domain-containing protein n=1 Tax=Fluviicola sp. TaxID=1917219 RepID=UPI002830AB2D|nr:helix-turn-helix transcriptional regulator [Fluviicola sp.]